MIELNVEDVLARVSDDLDDRLRLPLDPGKLAWHGRIILLKEKDGERVFPIWTGAFEGDMLAIALRIQDGSTRLEGATSPPRPMTHDLMTELIRVIGGHVRQVVITSLRDTTYYAAVSVAVDGRTEEVDARPSDAILLAVRTRAPIVVNEAVLDEAGLRPDALTEKLEAEAPHGSWRSLRAPNQN